MTSKAVLHRVAQVEARCVPFTWPWAEQNRDAIAANWRRRVADKPKMFNGRVMLLKDALFESNRCRITFFETDYADFIAWIDGGYPDRSVANAFAMGALRGSDGAYLCGVMAGQTVNAGRVYFPAGTPDRDDLRPDGTVDLASSLTRELIEETGLSETSFHVEDEWIIVEQGPVVALLRLVTLPMSAEEGARMIRAAIAAQAEPELADVRVIRDARDIDPQRMPLFLQSFFGWAFAGQEV